MDSPPTLTQWMLATITSDRGMLRDYRQLERHLEEPEFISQEWVGSINKHFMPYERAVAVIILREYADSLEALYEEEENGK